ncbi:MAG: hypothetical protein CSA26_06655 [Desulfobacterales bacterium]|nr:MAG: hypothetical protein CSA26_06655 [Desulfobacterales bacterium]
MEQQHIQQIKRYADLLVRRRVLIISCILIGLSSGLGIYLTVPKSYQSTTLLSYQQQKVNPAQMSPDQNAQIKDIVSTLAQIATSRTSLEKIINDNNLYQKEKRDLPMEDVVELMRENILITPSKKGDTFRITYTGNQPKVVARVANTLAAKFIEENLKYREERASETSAYTADELEMAKVMLDKKETVMRDYKLKYYNEMPDQRSVNMSRLSSLQEQYQNRQDSIQDLERTKVMIQDQVTARKQMKEENKKLRQALTTNTAPKEYIETEEEQLARLQNILAELLGKYTEKHPDIKRLKKIIANLEAKLKKKGQGKRAAQSGGQKETEAFDQILFGLNSQLRDIGLNIERLNKEKDELKKSIDQYEAWVAATPVREAEWSALTREYGELKRHYDFLVAQNLQARSALNLERKQKGSQFKIEDPARIPENPIEPVFFKFLGIAIAAGFALGASFALVLELLDTSFRDPDDLEKAFDIELICTIPRLALPKEQKRERIVFTIGTLVFLLSCSGIGTAFIYFWKQGEIVF